MCSAAQYPSPCAGSGTRRARPVKRCGSCTRAGGHVKSWRGKFGPPPPFRQLLLVTAALLLGSPQKIDEQDANCSECFTWVLPKGEDS